MVACAQSHECTHETARVVDLAARPVDAYLLYWSECFSTTKATNFIEAKDRGIIDVSI